MDINKMRVAALRKIMGGLGNKEFGERYGVDPSHLSQILNGHRSLGDKAAQTMERKIGLEPGKLVMPTWVLSELGAEPGPDIKGRIPLISWVRAGAWAEIADPFYPGEAEDWMPCPVNHSDSAFVLRVRGESMSNPHGPRSFNEGDLIFVDPERQASNGSLVIAKLTDSQEATFKQLVVDGEDRYLKALNPTWPKPYIKVDQDCHIVGVVFFKGEQL